LHWAAILFPRIKLDLAITGGVHSAADVLKAMMAGARVAMTTSALFKKGIGHLRVVLNELVNWMAEHEYHSIHQMQGSMSHWAVTEPAAFERGNYLRVLSSYTLSKGAGNPFDPIWERSRS
jgi:dihydroorotate dehydrogenase (fumarate)